MSVPSQRIRVTYLTVAVLIVAAAGVSLAGYVLGRSELDVERPVAVAADTARALVDPALLPTEAPQPRVRKVPRDPLSPQLSPIVLPRQKSYDLRPFLGTVIDSAPSKTRKVAITFDDGPSPNTQAVLRILLEHRARGTFFFVGNRMVGSETDVRAAVAQGSQVCNHTWDHAELEGLSAAGVQQEISDTQAEIQRVTGVRNEFVRPRGGRYDGTALKVIRRMGLILVGWDAEGADTFNDGKTVPQIERIAVQQTKGGSIVLFHELNPATVAALPAILDRLQSKGYEFVTLAQLLGQS